MHRSAALLLLLPLASTAAPHGPGSATRAPANELSAELRNVVVFVDFTLPLGTAPEP